MFSKSVNTNYPLKFIRLDPINGVKAFDCGDQDLNDFILGRAPEFQKYLLSVSYACVDVDDASKVYAYCSFAKMGCRFLTVDAYLKAVPFYEKNGFRFMNTEDDDPHTRLMYFDLIDLVA